MAEERHCSECGGELPADAPQGLCPQCLMKLGLPSGAEAEKPAAPDDQGAIPTSATPPSGFVPPEPAELAEKFPQLEILELLGQGGMGAVYKARQKQLDRLVALKILPPEVGQTEAFAERFTREARSMAKLHHPRIVTVFDFGQTADGLYYFIMEFVDGTDLRHVIQAGELSPDQALAIVPQVCEALHYAHKKGIVHRDIKPENILLDKEGNIKIADFGLVRLLDRPGTAYTLTQAGQRMGTPHYMAPEQIEHPHAVDHRADIYSLGVVFYEMLTGELPLGRFAPPSQKVRIDVRLDEIVLHTLEKEPERRYQHASEVKTDVETICAERSAGDVGEPKPEPGSVSLWVSSPDVYGIFGEAHGILRLEGSGLTLEYRVDDGFFGLLRSGVKKARIPLAEISSILVEQGLRRTRLTIQASTWSAMKGVPAAKAGQAKLYVSAKENASLVPFVEMLKQKLPDGTVSGFREPGSNEAGAIQQQSRGLARAMLTGGVITLMGGPLTAILILTKSSLVGHWEAEDWGLSTILLTILLIAQGLAVPLGGLVIAAAMNVRRRQGYGMAVAGAILLLLPLTVGSLVGIPLGIWVLVALNSEEVKAAFPHKKPQQKTAAQQEVSGPAIGLFAAALIFLASGLITGLVIMAQTRVIDSWQAGELRLGTTLFLLPMALAVLAPVLLVPAALNLRRLRSRGLVVAAGVLCLIPLTPGWLVTLPIGIWVLSALANPEVKAEFPGRTRERETDKPRICKLPVIGALWAPLGLVMLSFFFSPQFVYVTEEGAQGPPARSPLQWILLFTLLPLGVLAPFVSTTLGGLGISKIRSSQGQLIGMPLAVAVALFYPIFVLDGILLFIAARLGDTYNCLMICVAVTALVILALDFFIIRALWKAVTKSPDGTKEALGSKQTDVEPIENQSKPEAVDATQATRQQVRGAATGMLLAGLINLVLSPITGLWLLVEYRLIDHWEVGDWSATTTTLTSVVIAQVVAIPIAALVIAAALNMRRLHIYGLAVAGAVLLLLPLSPGSLLGLAMGIWALVVLSNKEVKAAFPQGTVDLSRQGKWNGFCMAALLISLVGGLMSIREIDPGDEVRDRIIWAAAIVLSSVFASIGLWQHAKCRGMHGKNLGIGIAALVIALAALVGFFVTIWYPVSW